MEDTRDKRPVYMSTFQRKLDKFQSQFSNDLDFLEARINNKIAHKVNIIYFIVGCIFFLIALNMYHKFV